MSDVKSQSVPVIVDDHRTTACVVGDGGPGAIVLVHPIGLDRHVWGPLARAVTSHAPLIAYDIRGFGDAAGAPPLTGIDQLADDLACVLDGLGVERADVVGLSLGGAVAQELALSHRARVRSLTLIATTDHGSPALRERADAVRREGPVAQVAPTLERWFTPATLRRRSPALAYARERLEAVNGAAIAAGWDALAAFTARDRLATLAIPTQVIAGERDSSAPVEAMRQIAARIPGARFDVVGDAGHMLPLERPEALAATLSRGPLSDSIA